MLKRRYAFDLRTNEIRAKFIDMVEKTKDGLEHLNVLQENR